MLMSLLSNLVKIIECFHSRDRWAWFSSKTKENVCIRIEINYRKITWGHQHGRRSFDLGTPTWPPWRHGKTLYSYNTDKKWLEQLLIFSFLCFLFSEAAENPSIIRTEVANASEILYKYLKCYDKRTRPNVTGWFVNIKFNYVSFCRAINIFLKLFFGFKRNNNVFQSIDWLSPWSVTDSFDWPAHGLAHSTAH